MKMFFAAVALAIASPAVAQDAAGADPHANHAPAAEQRTAPANGAHDAHRGHQMQGQCCCEKMKAEGAGMDCCDKSAAVEGAAEADPHAGHNMSGQ